MKTIKTNIRRSFFFFLFAIISINTMAQSPPFNIAIEPITIAELGGIQAFAYGQDNGKWLIIGGRLDGLHRLQPFSSFDVLGNNNQLLVIDPVAMEKWYAPLASLPISIQEQLSSTNMEFHQDSDILYIVGGYGYSQTAVNHITYPYLTAVDIPAVINAVTNGTNFTTFFRQISDDKFAVTGGYLHKLYNTYYLVGGQRFDGRYNPFNNPTFTQTYTNAIRKFIISDDGVNLSVLHFPDILDAENLHRRDYNVAAQVMPDGEEGLTAFSGVFQINADLPFLNCVNIDSAGYAVNNNFSQYYNHYHCAHIPLYSASSNEMHTLFFGGIAQYFESEGVLVQDDNVPFVRTIARVTRIADGSMAEYKLPVEMPALMGANSEFIPVENIPTYKNGVIILDDLTSDTTLVGYIYGGIASSAPNIFFINDGTQSSASNQIFKVYLIKNINTGIHELNPQSAGTLQMQIYPNPNKGSFLIKLNLLKKTDIILSIYDGYGKKIETEALKNLSVGENTFQKTTGTFTKGGIFFITLETQYEKVTQKIIITP